MNEVANWKRTFAIIWSGQGISILTSELVGYAVIFWLSLETGSAETLALAAVSGMLPRSVLGLFVGVYVDRWDRKRTMILADGFIALCTLALAWLFHRGAAELWHVYLLLACRSVGASFHTPAMRASIPLMAPESQLTRIAGVNLTLESLSCIAGPALGALLLAVTDLGQILLLDVLGALIACLTLLFVKVPNPPHNRTQRPNLWRELREGASAVMQVEGMSQLVLSAVVALFFIIPVGVLFPLMTLHHFGGGTFEMSLIEIVWGGGALLGGLYMGVSNYRGNRIRLINLMYLTVGCTFALSGLLPREGFYLFTFLAAIEGISGSVFNASFVAVTQQRIDPAVQGRFFSLYSGISMFPAMLGVLGTGFFTDAVGLQPTFVLFGLLVVLIGVVGLFSRRMNRLDRRP